MANRTEGHTYTHNTQFNNRHNEVIITMPYASDSFLNLFWRWNAFERASKMEPSCYNTESKEARM
jgi:hypothetical protein